LLNRLSTSWGKDFIRLLVTAASEDEILAAVNSPLPHAQFSPDNVNDNVNVGVQNHGLIDRGKAHPNVDIDADAYDVVSSDINEEVSDVDVGIGSSPPLTY